MNLKLVKNINESNKVDLFLIKVKFLNDVRTNNVKILDYNKPCCMDYYGYEEVWNFGISDKMLKNEVDKYENDTCVVLCKLLHNTTIYPTIEKIIYNISKKEWYI